ncbi:hypothetical protein BGX26_011156 [Mortierella sp. AD094]|nr:hypothetical protein BGX26_011156 [Mortierella sp. AD094]
MDEKRLQDRIYDEAMAMIPRVSDFPGCERWIDMRTVTELELRGLPKRDPDYQPAVYNYEDDDGDSNSDSWSWRDGCMEKLTEEGILEEEDEEECDLDQDDDDDAIVVNGSWFNGYREEL